MPTSIALVSVVICVSTWVTLGAAAETGEAWGPLIERTVADDNPNTGGKFLIDLDTGRLFDMPAQLPPGGAKTPFQWMAEQGIDAYGEGGDDGLIGLDMMARPIESTIAESFPQFPDAMTTRFVEQLSSWGKPGTPISLNAKAGVGPAATYLFQTREGTSGVLQIVGWREKDMGVRIRYRLRSPGKHAIAGADETANAAAVPEGRLNAVSEIRVGYLDEPGAEAPTFDLDSAKIIRNPERNAAAAQGRCLTQLVAKPRPTGQMRLDDAAVTRVSALMWDRPEEAERNLQWLVPARPSPSVVLPYADQLPVVYLFKTCRGRLGMLQIVESGQAGMMFRYRMLEQTTATP